MLATLTLTLAAAAAAQSSDVVSLAPLSSCTKLGKAVCCALRPAAASLFPQLLARTPLTNSTSQTSHAAETAPVSWPQTQIAPACHIIAVQLDRETPPPR